MDGQQRGGNSSALGFESRYSFRLRYAPKEYDYLIQRQKGDVVVGHVNCGRRTAGDDTKTDMLPLAHLRGCFHEVAAQPSPTVPAAARHV